MHELPEDIERLQALLDRSDERAGPHLRSIFTPERRVAAQELCALLTGVQVLNVATVTRRGEPRVAPVDGLFYRGEWWFGSSADSVRFRHIRARPQVSASHTRGESLAVIVHGEAVMVDLTEERHTGIRAYGCEVYGAGWDEWAAGAPYVRIAAHAMFTMAMDAGKGE
ncbi:MAG: pyridoxamine 5'-phosphate oxidase family protein [Dehalococcoidia bacterium]